MNEIWIFLGKYIHPIETPEQWLPIVALVIGWYLATRSTYFLQKDKYLQDSALPQTILFQRLLGAVRKYCFCHF